jgi:hypothetical protein
LVVSAAFLPVFFGDLLIEEAEAGQSSVLIHDN